MNTRETTVKGKIRRFAMEGMLIRKSFEKIITPLDRWLGIRVRSSYTKKTPVDPKKIMFITFQGEYTCNPKYICEELLKEGVDFKMVWVASKLSAVAGAGFPKGAVVVEENSEEFFKELASAKIWIANSVEFLKRGMPKKKDQVMIETWHGSLGIKRFDKGVNSGKGWVRAAEYTTKICDYIISNSDFEDQIYRTSFWPKQEIWKIGHPRNDVLINKEEQQKIKAHIHAYYKIDPQTKICLYAPTFRDSHTFDFYNIDYDRLLAALETKFGGTWNIMLRFHPTVKMYVNASATNEAGGKIKDATDYPDMQDLIVAADIGITDYSSWIYDFVLTGNPGFLYAADLKDYYNERGFAYSLYDTPFPVAQNNDELIAAVEAFDNASYQKEVKSFLEGKGCIEDGNASRKAAEKIKQILGS